MKHIYNYKKINKRIEELESMRDKRGHFTGTYEELDELMNLDTYKRQTLAHALCLDFKTNITYVENYFPVGKDIKVKTTTRFLVLDDIPYTAELEQIEEEKHKCFNYKEILVLKPLWGDKERRFMVENIDISCCDCYYVREELAA